MAKSKKSLPPNVPTEIFAQVSPKSIGGRSLFEPGEIATNDNVQNYLSERGVVLNAVEELKKSGFKVLQITNSTINISGGADTFKRAFGSEVHAREVESMKSGPEKEAVTILDTVHTDVQGLIVPKSGSMANYIEGVAIEMPYYYFTPNRFPPKKEYWHLEVPGDVSLGCNADKAHRGGYTGRGVRVAMVDSGFYRHPFFSSRGYRVNTTVVAPGASNGTVDTNGHGTAEAANIFATAPDCRLTPVKMSFVNTTAAFNAAVSSNPDIITCSWGSSIRNPPLSAANQVLGAAIASAVSRGIIVIFSAGNGHWGFPGQHPDVISAGGVYMDQNLNLSASNYSSGFDSNIFPGRRVPDLCGLVGQRPRAAYIMLPLQEGCSIDVSLAGGNHPNGDETGANDGWAAISGTSAAAPQLAGVAALIKQVCRRLSPNQVREIMKRTSIDVRTGTNNNGNSSVVGPDNSTGHGLVDAYKATLRARLTCRFVPPLIPPIRPVLPVLPVIPPIPPVINPVNPPNPLDMASEDLQKTENDPNFTQTESNFLSNEDIEELMVMLEQGKLDIDEI